KMSSRIVYRWFWKVANHNASAGVVQIGGRRRLFIFILYITILLAFRAEWWLPARAESHLWITAAARPR
ncbi:TPA: hypothetical protein ACXEV9_005729, partial [Klebsiella pneumoniae]